VTSGHVHIIGAGLAGLSAAVSLVKAGRNVTLYEAGPAAGGRCRSYFDRALGCRIDNGNHLLLSGNTAAMDYLDTIGARDTLGGPASAMFPFIDLASGERWIVRPSEGRIPWWVFSRGRRVLGTSWLDYAQLLALRRPAPDATVAEVLRTNSLLYRRLLEPLAIAALNTAPEIALASLLAVVVRETLEPGGAACVPLVPRQGLSESLVDPAIAWLTARGATVRTGLRIAGVSVESDRVVALQSPDGTIALGSDEAMILAVPPWIAPELLPGVSAPDRFEAILNVHFRLRVPPGEAGFLGVVGGTAEWIFVKNDVVSVTISAANRLVDLPPEVISARVWQDVCASLSLAEPMPPVRVVKEKRATFMATAAQERRRPSARFGLRNVALAGDWTATGLPATIEGAIRSGSESAKVLA
jgi:squalene-associated FAD-dependent desaturase